MFRPFRPSLLAAFLLTVTVAVAFAVATQHAWEDYYITFRTSRNLATGHGLVFNHGDRLHTFTSPLGVLLPAVASLLTFNQSDEGALWIFRLMSCAALGGAACLLTSAARQLRFAAIAVVFLIGWLALDSKTVDFAINGMETGFLLLFLAYALWAQLVPSERRSWHLGAAWAGLMWSRPDSFIYVGLIAAGFWFFNESARSGLDRRQLLNLYLRAGLVATALYLPWLLFAWGYYGTPVPHTITAKSGFGDPRTLLGLAKAAINLPFTAWTPNTSLEATFLPAYYMIGGWPEHLVQILRALAAICSLLWVVPFLRFETRATSFAFFGAHAYLNYYPYFPFPWYIPSTTLLACFCLASLLAQLIDVGRAASATTPASPRARLALGFAVIATLLFLSATGWMLLESGRLFAAQQKYVENGNRRKIGEWLRAHSLPGDTVFLEPLGYIGYFSGLKTYDFPGMSSREMVAARHKVGVSWALLIDHLQPRWVVLRPHEVNRVKTDLPGLLDERYVLAQEFSVLPEIEKINNFGRAYLEHDSRFMVYENRIQPANLLALQNESAAPISHLAIDGVEVSFAHAPSALKRLVPQYARSATVRFGFIPSAYVPAPDQTDGALFKVEMVVGTKVTVLAERLLRPSTEAADRGLQSFSFELPEQTAPTILVLRALSGESRSKDWTCWSDVQFR